MDWTDSTVVFILQSTELFVGNIKSLMQSSWDNYRVERQDKAFDIQIK